MEILLIIGVVSLVIIVWVNILATIAVRYDQTLNTFQRNSQSLFIWFVPIIGASFILKLVFEHSPDAIPKGWILWPLKGMIYGKPMKPNINRDDRETDGVYDRSRGNNDFGGDSSGGEGGGGGD